MPHCLSHHVSNSSVSAVTILESPARADVWPLWMFQGPPCGQKRKSSQWWFRKAFPWCCPVDPLLAYHLPSYSGWTTVSVHCAHHREHTVLLLSPGPASDILIFMLNIHSLQSYKNATNCGSGIMGNAVFTVENTAWVGWQMFNSVFNLHFTK